jgi:hypothetical protein
MGADLLGICPTLHTFKRATLSLDVARYSLFLRRAKNSQDVLNDIITYVLIISAHFTSSFLIIYYLNTISDKTFNIIL